MAVCIGPGTSVSRTRGGRALGRAAALAVYGALSFALFGRGVVGTLNDRVVGDEGADKTLYMWSLEWWPKALAHLRNPLDVTVAWAPHGFDFGLGTGGGGLAVVAAPLTSVVGPVSAYNLLALTAPMLAAATAFVLAYRLTGKFAPSLAGGWVFGFSSYELGHLLGHLPLAFVALVPVAPYLVLRRHAGELSRRMFVAALAALLVGEFLIVPQILFSLVLMGGVAAVAAVIVLGLQCVRTTLMETGIALLGALGLLSPIVGYAIVAHEVAPARSPFAESADLLNYVVPTRRTWLRPPGTPDIAERFTGTGAEQGAYLGLPFVVLIVLAVVAPRRSRPRLLLPIVFVAALILSLGTRVKIAGEVVGVGPWAALAPVPIVGSALPNRMTMYTALLAGLLVAIALSDRTSVARWLLVAAGVAATLPNLQLGQWSSQVARPEFFARRSDMRHIAAGSTALLLPYGPAGWSMLWQAEAGFRFRIVGGHFGLRVTREEREWRDVYEALGTGRVQPSRLRVFLAAHHVDVVVVAPGTRGSVRRVVAASADGEPERVLDALVYRLSSGRLATGCRVVSAKTQTRRRCAIKHKEH